MRAMDYRRPLRVQVNEKVMPLLVHLNDATVRVQVAAICATDLHLYHGMTADTRPHFDPGKRACAALGATERLTSG